MPLSERARVEVYLPDLPSPVYQELQDRLFREFTYAFGGCSLIQGIHGSYLSEIGIPVEDRVNLLFTDTPFHFDAEFEKLGRYAKRLREAAFEALDEEAILVAVLKVYHSD